MASVDVPVALLGYGTVGAAVNRLLVESAEEIERATGHRLRVVRALVRDADKEREFAPATGVLTTDFATIRDDPSIAVVAEVMGGVEPTGELRARAAPRGQARRLREQAAARPARRRAVRGRVRGGRAAPLRGVGLRRDPGDQGAARVARRDERAPRARDRQRHDELHPHADGGGRRRTPRRSPRRSGSGTRRPIRPTTSPAPTRRRRWRSSQRSRSARASSSTDVAYRGIEGSTPAHVAAARDARHGRAARRHGDARRRRGRRPRRAGARRPRHPLAAVDGAVQRGHAAGRRDPRDHARGPGRGRHRDGLRRRGGHGQRDRHDRHRLPAERRVLARAAEAARRRRCARRSTSGSRSPTGPACSRTSPSASPTRASRSRGSTQHPSNGSAGARHRHARGARRPRSRPRSGAICGARPRSQSSPRGRCRVDLRTGACATDVTLGEGNTPLLARAAPLGAARRRALAQVGGREPDRLLQGPRDGRRGHACARARGRRRSSAPRPGTRPRRPQRTGRARGCRRSSSSTPRGAVARGKLAQARRRRRRRCARSTAASTTRICARGSLRRARATSTSTRSTPTGSRARSRAALEILEQLGGLPDVLALPYGGGGNTVAYAKGFDELGQGLPTLLPAQAAERLTTFATRDPDRRRRCIASEVERAARAVRRQDRHGLGGADRPRPGARSAREEGVFCEPASAAGDRRGRGGGPRDRDARRLRRHGPRPQGPATLSRRCEVQSRSGDDRQPRPGIRLRGGRARPLERARAGRGGDATEPLPDRSISACGRSRGSRRPDG